MVSVNSSIFMKCLNYVASKNHLSFFEAVWDKALLQGVGGDNSPSERRVSFLFPLIVKVMIKL